MPPKGGKETPVTPGMIQRLREGVSFVISGVKPSTWMSPLEPLNPVAQDVQGRNWDFQVGYNTLVTAKTQEGVSFATLRGLADSCDVLRSVIEDRKDQMEALKWRVKLRGDDAKVDETDDPRIEPIEAFFKKPDRIHTWKQWLRMALEEVLVTDSLSVYRWRTKGGAPYSFDLIDGTTIVPKIDDRGKTPEAPDVAYQQVLKGTPAADYSRDELIYFLRNPRVGHIYGYSPTEQIIVTINIAIRRIVHQLQYYTEGNLPDALIGTPANWTPAQVKQFQEYWDALYTGNTAQRRHGKFVPGDANNVHELVQPPLKDLYDEWIARVVCFCFKVSPQPFVAQVNRATAETAHATSQEAGLISSKETVKSLMDMILAEDFKSPDLEFVWEDADDHDPVQESTILVTETGKGLMTINEARERKGLEPVKGNADRLGFVTSSGWVPLDPTPEEQAAKQAALMPPEDPGADDKKDEKKPPDKKAEKLQKKKVSTYIERGVVKHAISNTKHKVLSVLHEAAHSVRSQIGQLLKADHLAKADPDPASIAGAIVAEINLDSLDGIESAVVDDLIKIAQDSAHDALQQIGYENLFGKASATATTWARGHAADLVSQITEATRDQLRAELAEAIAEGTPRNQIAQDIGNAYAFSDERAQLIAGTEIAFANGEGALEGYRQAKAIGVKVKKEWLIDTDPCPICQDNAAAGAIEIEDNFPSGDDSSPAHPRCECSISPVVEE